MISFKEFQTQLAVGAIQSNTEIAGLIKISADTKIIVWAGHHKSCKVRQAAVKHPLCPLSMLIKAACADRSTMVRHDARQMILKRLPEFEYYLEIFRDYPQLTLPFSPRDLKTIPSGLKNNNDNGDNDDNDDWPPF